MPIENLLCVKREYLKTVVVGARLSVAGGVLLEYGRSIYVGFRAPANGG